MPAHIKPNASTGPQNITVILSSSLVDMLSQHVMTVEVITIRGTKMNATMFIGSLHNMAWHKTLGQRLSAE